MVLEPPSPYRNSAPSTSASTASVSVDEEVLPKGANDKACKIRDGDRSSLGPPQARSRLEVKRSGGIQVVHLGPV